MPKKNKKISKNEFRYNYDTKHPSYVFMEDENKYKAFGLTHKNKTFNKTNMPLSKNPNPDDENTSYLRNGVVSSKKKNFSPILKNFVFSDEDFKNVKSKIRNYKNKIRKK